MYRVGLYPAPLGSQPTKNWHRLWYYETGNGGRKNIYFLIHSMGIILKWALKNWVGMCGLVARVWHWPLTTVKYQTCKCIDLYHNSLMCLYFIGNFTGAHAKWKSLWSSDWPMDVSNVGRNSGQSCQSSTASSISFQWQWSNKCATQSSTSYRYVDRWIYVYGFKHVTKCCSR